VEPPLGKRSKPNQVFISKTMITVADVIEIGVIDGHAALNKGRKSLRHNQHGIFIEHAPRL